MWSRIGGSLGTIIVGTTAVVDSWVTDMVVVRDKIRDTYSPLKCECYFTMCKITKEERHLLLRLHIFTSP